MKVVFVNRQLELKSLFKCLFCLGLSKFNLV